MPYKFDTDHIHLTEQQNRRIKLTQDQRAAIFNEHHINGSGIRFLSRQYKVDKRLIQFICYPEREARNKELRARRGGWKQYYSKDANTKAHREHRRYKQSILKEKL